MRAVAPSHSELRKFLLRDLVPRVGDSPHISALSVKPSGHSSWYATYEVGVKLSSGSSMTLFLKDYGTYRAEKKDMRSRRERERYVYKDLISGERIGTARYFGSWWDEEDRRFWLLLEFVHGVPLQFLEFEQWLKAAAWLARLQGWSKARFSPAAFRSPLLRHDSGLFRRTATEAILAVGTFSEALRRRLENLLDGYADFFQTLKNQPLTLVHGAFLPSQIIVDVEATGDRVCPVDWELAAVGSPYYDLAFLVYGFDQARLGLLLEAYREEARRQNLWVPELPELRRITSSFCIHKTLMSLGHSAERGYTEEAVSEYLHVLESLVPGQ